ncbi:MAG: hypothetical protein AAGA99_00230 [Actinomycetota bacterium]
MDGCWRQARRALAVITIAMAAAACTSSGDDAVEEVIDPAPTTETTARPPLAAPEGERIVVDRSGAEIVIVEVDSGDEMVVSSPDETIVRQPVWSRDGRFVAWASFSPDGGAAIRWLDPSVGTDGAAETDSLAFYLAFDQQGSAIAWLGSLGSSVSLAVVDLANARDQLLDDAVPYFVDWLPDGVLVAHVGATEVRAVTADGSRLLAPGTVTMQAPEVAPDGTVVVVRDEAGGDGPGLIDVSVDDVPPVLVRLDADGELLEELTELPDAPIAFDLDPTGSRVAVWERTAGGPVLVVDLATGESDTVGDDGTLAVTWSPDGSRLAFLQGVGDGTGRWTFWDGETLVAAPAFRPTDTFVRDYLPFWDQYLRTATPWAPDSSAIVHAAVVDGEPTVLVQGADGGEPRALGPGDMAWWAPRGELDERSAP